MLRSGTVLGDSSRQFGPRGDTIYLIIRLNVEKLREFEVLSRHNYAPTRIGIHGTEIHQITQ